MVRRKTINIILPFILITSSVMLLLPIIITILCSIGIDFNRGISFSLQGYKDFFIWKPLYLKAYQRSLIIASSSMIGTLLIAVPAAYLFAKVTFRGKGFIFYVYIIVMMMPFQVTLLPQYIVSRHFEIYDTLFAIILPGISSPFPVFLLTQVTKSLPNEILEAARLDTSNTYLVLSKIIVPIIQPGIICTAVLVFTDYWNMVAEPLVLLESKENYPLSVLLSFMSTSGLLGFATTVVFMTLPLLLFSFFETDISKGLEEYRLKY